MANATSRLETFRSLLEDAHRALALSFGFELWDGSSVPRDLAPEAMRLVIAKESVIASLLRRPTLDTAGQRPCGGPARPAQRHDLRPRGAAPARQGRTPAAILEQAQGRPGRPAVPAGARRHAPPPRPGEGGPPTPATGSPSPTSATSPIITTSRTPSTGSSSIRRWSTPAPISTRWHDDLARAQRDKLDMICRKLRLKPGDRLLDIGCGWGALVCHAAQHYGVTRDGRDARRGAGGARPREDRAARPCRTGSRCWLQDFTQWRASSTRSRRSACSSMSGSPITRPISRPCTGCSSRGASTCTTPSRGGPSAPTRRSAGSSPEYKALTRYIFPGGELDHLGMSVANLERYGFEVHDVEGWREHYAAHHAASGGRT